MISLLFFSRAPNEDTDINIKIKEDPQFEEEVENYFSKEHSTLPNDKVGNNSIHGYMNLFGRKKKEEEKHSGGNKNDTRNKKYKKKFNDRNADYMNFVGRG